MKTVIASYPYAMERVYSVTLSRLVGSLGDLVDEILVPAYVAGYAELPETERQDAWPELLERAISRLSFAAKDVIRAGQRAVPGVARNVANTNRTGWRRWADKLIGVNVFKSRGEAAWINPLVTSWSLENSKLISSISTQYLDQVAQRSQDMLRSGTSPKHFSVELARIYGITMGRAKLIARTEVAKLNGQLTRARQMRLGISIYIWSTSKDERVRPSHDALEGKECLWDDPTVFRDPGGAWQKREGIGAYIGHPGTDFQCRCVSYADVESALDELLQQPAA